MDDPQKKFRYFLLVKMRKKNVFLETIQTFESKLRSMNSPQKQVLFYSDQKWKMASTGVQQLKTGCNMMVVNLQRKYWCHGTSCLILCLCLIHCGRKTTIRFQTKVSRKVCRYQRSNQKNRQYNGQKKKDKGTSNDLQNTTQKTKD